MAVRAPSKVQQAAPSETLTGLNLGYNGYTDVTQTKPQMWAAPSQNAFSGAFGFIQRSRFANVATNALSPTQPFTTMKYFALPGLGAYLMADSNGKLWSYDTGNNYSIVQRLSPIDSFGIGNSRLNGPWSREALGNILYEMNGQVKQASRGANALTIEGFGLDAPDASPQVTINAGVSTPISSITRANGVVTATVTNTAPFVSGLVYNAGAITDASFNGSFVITIVDSTHFTWSQFGQNVTSSGGAVSTSMTKAVGRSYAYAWENANKSHVGAQSPATQYIQYTNQNGTLQMTEPGTVSSSGGITINGIGTFFTSAWIGRNIWINGQGNFGPIVSVLNASQMTIAANNPCPAFSSSVFQIFDQQSTHIRIYATADGGATYFRIARNIWSPVISTLSGAGLIYIDEANAEPPNFPYTTETVQANNVPPPVGSFLVDYQGVLCVFGVPGALQSFFYSNQTATSIGLQQESFAPLNQVTLPIKNAKMNGMVSMPGDAIIWSDKQDMFRLSGLLSDNTVTGVAQSNAAAQQGATIARLPYNLGIANPFAVDITPLGAIWLTSNAEAWLFTDKYAPRNIGRPIQDILNSILPANLNLVRAKYYHTNTRNWFVLSVPANFGSFNNTLLILDLDLLASNGSPSYFTFDMATNSPAWWVFQPGTSVNGTWSPRCDSLEVVYENQGIVRLLVGQVNLIQDVDYTQGFGTEINIPNGSVKLHAWGNDTSAMLKRPNWVRFNTNRDPSLLKTDGWSFKTLGIDDDYYTFESPLALSHIPGVNDSSTLGGNPDFIGGMAFRHSPELYKIGGVNFVMGRRFQFVVNFPPAPGVFQFRSVQLGFGVAPPS